MPIGAKVFGIGLSKTGGVSLSVALKRLEYRALHWPPLAQVVQLAQEYDALTDTPVIPYLECLDRLFPDAKFILTDRDEASWLDSCRRWWEQHSLGNDNRRWVRRVIYGRETFDAETFQRVRIVHRHHVEGYFRGREAKLLILDICGGEGYERLCPFLGLPIVNECFPHENRGKP